MIEIELKSIVTDLEGLRKSLTQSGATLSFEGELEDRRYDTAERRLLERDEVLRLRVYRDARGARAQLDWKGPTSYVNGYKRREELSTSLDDADALTTMLDRLGYEVTMEIDRHIWQYEIGGATVRLERYPRMDDLVEVEGEPEEIERAIGILGLPRDGFNTDRLPDFVRRFEERTGERALISDADVAGESTYDHSNA